MTDLAQEPAAPPNVLRVGANREKGVVVLTMGGSIQAVNPATARAYAIGLIHAAEVAGLPAPPPEMTSEQLDESV